MHGDDVTTSSGAAPPFFVPTCDSNYEAEHWWQIARQRAEGEGWQCGRRRIFRIRVTGDDREQVIEVGKPAEFDEGRRLVGAIFDALDSYVLYPVVGPIRAVPKAAVGPVVAFADRGAA